MKNNTEVVCVAQNDAMLGGLLTVIHSEVNERGMSSLQVRARHVLRYRRLSLAHTP